jgi:hypothetical protein
VCKLIELIPQPAAAERLTRIVLPAGRDRIGASYVQMPIS